MWTNRTLGSICDDVGGTIRTGPFGSQLHQSEYSADGLPVVMPKDIIDGQISTATIARIPADVEARLSSHKLRKGDIVYGRRGDIGRRALIRDREAGWLCGTGSLRISLGVNVLDPGFLYHYLGQEMVIEWIYNQAVGATLPNLNTGIIRSISVTYPPIATQRTIAGILSTYDDLIENNRCRIKLLEEMASNIYDEWFVRFRFPGHWQSLMVDSPVGPLPKDWGAMTLGAVLSLEYGRALKAGERKGGPVPVYGSSGVVGYHDTALVSGPGLIVGRKGNVGSVFWSDKDFFPIDTVFYVATTLPLHYVYYNLQRQNFLNNDAAVPGLSRHQAYSLRCIVPPPQLLDAFSHFVQPVFEELALLRRKIAVIRETRDLLLPKLISGEIDVTGLDIDTGALETDAA